MLALHYLLSVLSGGLVGFTLGPVNGGGSILAGPLLVYVVGVPGTHVAIGPSALAVAALAAVNLFGHTHKRTVRWPCTITFALAGIVGPATGAHIGKLVDRHKLLLLFGVLMLVVGALMLRSRKSGGDPDVRLNPMSASRLLPFLIGTGFPVGALSGFFGIGGGFLIVNGLMAATTIPLINAIGSSPVSVTAFGLATRSELRLVRFG